ncbi:unnamed protein product [Prorocentrum cordatum]|uniref:Uncharacterized protein n=1 Tax=Prorocentrum cordatum TaxID=2364126 RepID=A0ABN9UGE9_9DINO|nr:unnamed protein product [Polarella glacialis]
MSNDKGSNNGQRSDGRNHQKDSAGRFGMGTSNLRPTHVLAKINRDSFLRTRASMNITTACYVYEPWHSSNPMKNCLHHYLHIVAQAIARLVRLQHAGPRILTSNPISMHVQ